MEWSCFESDDLDDFREQEFDLYSQLESVMLKREHIDPRRVIEIMKEEKLLSEQLREFSD